MYISEETIRRIEKGENDPRLSTLVPLCNYLDIDLKDIISGKEFEYKNLLSLRNEIHYLINNYSIEKATRLIKNLDELSFDSHIYYEKELFATRHYFNGVISVIKNENRKDSLNDFEIALSEMNSKFKINKFKDYKYDNFSLRILLAIALNEYRIGNFELYKDIILVIKDYLDLSLDNYFLFAYNVAAYYSRVGNYLESLRICNEAANNAKIIKEAYYLNMLYYIKGVNHVYLEQLKEASLSFNYCLALTNIFSEKSLANSISKQINTLMANHK